MPVKVPSKVKYKKRNKPIFIFAAVLVFCVCAVYQLVSMQVEIAQKNSEYENLLNQRLQIEEQNDQLERYGEEENKSEYIEEIARDKFGYARPEERVYYIVPSV